MERERFALALVLIIAASGFSIAGIQYLNFVSLNESFLGVQTDYESLESDFNTMSDEYNQLQADFAEMEDDYQSLLVDYASLSAVFLLLGENNTDLQDQLNQLKAEFGALNESFVSLNQLYDELSANYTQLQQDYDNLQADYDSLMTNYTDLQAQYAVLDAQHDALLVQYTTLQLEFIVLNTTYYDLRSDYEQLESDYNDLANELDALQLSYDTLTTWIRQTTLPVQFGIFAEAVRRYYFEDFYVQDKWATGNYSGYWSEFARFMRDVALHDSAQMIEGRVIGQDSEFLIIPPEGYDPFEGVIVLENFAWYKVDGITNGDNIRVTVDFTNDDTDVMVWWADTDNSTWTFANNLVGYEMSTFSNPETGSFSATRNGSIMIGIFDFDRTAGIWSARVSTQFGVFNTVSEVLVDALMFGGLTEKLAWEIMTDVFDATNTIDFWGLDELEGLDAVDIISNVVLQCINSIDYEWDSAITRGQEEYAWDYIKFPVETAFRTMGDCEDQAILAASYLESCGFETTIAIIIDPTWNNGAGLSHGALLVKIPSDAVFDFVSRYPNATYNWRFNHWNGGEPLNEGCWVWVDTTWDTPFGTDPAWLDWYTSHSGVFFDHLTLALCGPNGQIISSDALYSYGWSG